MITGDLARAREMYRQYQQTSGDRTLRRSR
jgi:hypothetical protein